MLTRLRDLLARLIPRLVRQTRADHLKLGRRGERLAERFLKKRRFRLLGRNVRTRGGEADLVMLDPDGRTIVVVEVKARAGGTLDPTSAIGVNKRRRLVSTAEALRRMRGWEDRPCRIDVVSVWWHRPRGSPEVRHLPGAVSAGT